jgi:ribA/ribD-fused uncharacterized protein
MEGVISFDGHRSKNGYLSTSYPSMLVDDKGRHYSTPDHYYYSRVGIHDDGTATRKGVEIINAPSASKAKELCGHDTDSWDDKKRLTVMTTALLLKFNQNEKLKSKLLGTKGYKLVFRGSDPFWGLGKDGEGGNKLGLLLMKIREFLIDEQAKEQAKEQSKKQHA